jgi:hypothetical protein
VSGKRSFGIGLSILWWTLQSAQPSGAQEFRGDLSVLGQVREGDFTREAEAPHDLYGDLGLSHLPYASIDTFFRLERDFGVDDGASDFYAGYLHSPAAIPGVDFTVGRQFLSEGPGGAYVADAGKVRFDPGGPVALTVFGGAPRYFEPTYSKELLSQDEVIWGGNIATTRLRGGRLALGYLQLERDQHVLRQLVTATGSQSFSSLPGLPNLYGSVAYDADRQNLDLATMGASIFLSQPRLLLNLESSYYKPQDQGDRLQPDLDRREDSVFELFSLSEMMQYRGGLRYAFSSTVSAYGDYSYQRYESLPGRFENGHVGGSGLLWLPGGDGLEAVRVEYYVIDSGGGNVNGGKASYENRVYERLLFRTKVDVSHYDKRNNQEDTAVSSLLALGYLVCPGLTWETYFEANHNDRFDEDFRFGFLINYRLHHRVQRAAATATEESS